MSILVLTSDTLISPAAVGNIEYSSPVFTGTPVGTQRGVIPTEQFYALNANLAGSNATGAQNILGVGVTLSASTQYEFEILFAMSKSAGTTSHTVSLGFGGTATVNSIIYNINWYYNATSFNSTVTLATSTQSIIQTASSTVMSGAIAAAATYYYGVIKGIVSINAGGTFIPQYTLSAAPGGAYTTQAGSYMKIKPLGASGANISVGAWA